MNTITARILLVGLVATWFGVVGCDEKKSETTDAGAADAAGAQIDTSAPVDATPADAGSEAEKVQLDPPLEELPPDLEELKASVSGEQIGTVTGDVYGEKSPVRAIARGSCGEGTVLQVVFEKDGEFQVSPVTPVKFFGLATKKAVTYEEGPFEVTIDFEHDTPERLHGHLKITYVRRGETKTYMDLHVDGVPIAAPLPVEMSGEGEVPRYTQCVPTGYFEAIEEDGTKTRGYLNTRNLADRGVPLIWVLLTPQDGIQMMVIPPPERSIEEPHTVSLEKARERGTLPAALLVDAWHLEELWPPEEATGVNVGGRDEVGVFDGEATYRLFGEGNERRVQITLTDVRIPEMVPGPMKGRKFSTIRVDAYLADQGQERDRLPPPPDWW